MVKNPKRLIPLAAMEKILKNAGADRVSDKAKQVLKEVLEEYAKQLATKSITYAEHAKRRTINAEDIKLASKS